MQPSLLELAAACSVQLTCAAASLVGGGAIDSACSQWRRSCSAKQYHSSSQQSAVSSRQSACAVGSVDRQLDGHIGTQLSSVHIRTTCEASTGGHRLCLVLALPLPLYLYLHLSCACPCLLPAARPMGTPGTHLSRSSACQCCRCTLQAWPGNAAGGRSVKGRAGSGPRCHSVFGQGNFRV